MLEGPAVAKMGRSVLFDASRSFDPQGKTISFRWDLGGTIHSEPSVRHMFTRAGVLPGRPDRRNGVLADLAFRDLLVVNEVKEEIGTEGQASRWASGIEGDNGHAARLVFATIRTESSVAPLCGFARTSTPAWTSRRSIPSRATHVGICRSRKRISFWMKYRNPNPSGFQDAGPVVALEGPKGRIVYTPAAGENFLRDTEASEERWVWQRIVIPLEGGKSWKREDTGVVALDRIDAVSLTFDSWENEPFTIWLDGLAFE